MAVGLALLVQLAATPVGRLLLSTWAGSRLCAGTAAKFKQGGQMDCVAQLSADISRFCPVFLSVIGPHCPKGETSAAELAIGAMLAHPKDEVAPQTFPMPPIFDKCHAIPVLPGGF